jgi:serine protease SohB
MPEHKHRSSLKARLRSLVPSRFRGGPRIPVVRLEGAIGRTGPLSRGMSLESVAGVLDKAFGDDAAPAVALVINSPGGSAAQSHLIHARIRALAAETDKAVFAFVEDVAASGGYMIACAADEIHADAASIVGSIGVVSGGFGFTEAIGRLGIERRLYTAGESKAMLDPFLPEKPEQVARLKEMQAAIHAHFISLVRDRRGERLKEQQEALFTGAFWAGDRALELGLVDGLGDLRSVLRARFGTRVKLVEMRGRKGFGLRRLLGAEGSGLADALAATLDERALWSRYRL